VIQFATFAIIAWPILSVILFAVLDNKRTAAMITVIGGFLFLPVYGFRAEGYPPYTADTAIAIGALVGILFFCPGAITQLRWSWLDLFAVVSFCGWGVSSLVNGLGFNDAVLQWIDFLVTYGVIYVVGRSLFATPQALKELAVGVAVATMIYMPLVIWEMRMSPRLHLNIYGFQTRSWMDAARGATWRPRVFLSISLALAVWLAASTLTMWWLWLAGGVRKVLGLPMVVLCPGGAALTYFTRCLGAFLLLVCGIACLVTVRYLGIRRALFVMPLVVAIYVTTGLGAPYVPIREWPLQMIKSVNPDKAQSLNFRFVHEAVIVEHSMERPLFGWGGWGRNRPRGAEVLEFTAAGGVGIGREEAITDGAWVIYLGQKGLVGLVGLWGLFVVPGAMATVWVLRLRMPLAQGAPIFGLAAFCSLYSIDLLLNAFPTPALPMICGALVSFVVLASNYKRPDQVVRSGQSVISVPTRARPAAVR
jgi:hypothetical protein